MNNIANMYDLLENAENYRKQLESIELNQFKEFTFEDFIYTTNIISKNKKAIKKQ